MPRAVLRSPIAEARVARAAAWLAARARSEEVAILGAGVDAPAELARSVARAHGASFGWHRATLGRTAAALAAPELAARGLSPVGALPLEALCARVVDSLRRAGALGRFQEVAHFPGLPRALARTLAEVRLADLDPEAIRAASPELHEVHVAYEAELARAGLADRALVFRIAAEIARAHHTHGSKRASAGAVLSRPLLLLDVPISCALERDLIAALAARAPDVLATVPLGDEQSLDNLCAALGVDPSRVEGDLDVPDGAPSLRRLQSYLFSGAPAPAGALGDDVVVLSAPGESRECVEIARLIHREAARGVPFDRMAILLRAPAQYRAHLEEALRRASIPAHFTRGTVEPDPAGRAFVALLSCAIEKLSARRFAEYLSLGQVPDATAEGEPPPPMPAADRWVPPDEELVSDRIRAAEVDRARPDDARDGDLEPGPKSASAPAFGGTLRAPRRWERLLLESAVIGGLDRWDARLGAFDRKLALDLEALDKADDTAAERVLAVLAELLPMASVGPVDLTEVRLVLTRRLTDLVVPPAERAAGRVFVAPVFAARGHSFDVVFVPGVAERLFPQKVTEEPILRDRDRASLGLDGNHERVAAERLALRLAVGAAQKRLILSYPRVDMDQSRPRVPSFYGLEILRAAEGRLPGFDELASRAENASGARIGWPAPKAPELAIDEAEYDLALLERLFRLPEQDTIGTARYLLGESAHLARALRFRARRWTVKKWMNVDGLIEPTGRARAALDKHAFSARSFSPTALQTFASCPYRFLLYAVHRLSPRQAPEAIEEMDPLQRGSLVHEALYELSDVLRAEDLLPVTEANLERARAHLDDALDRVAARFHDDLAPAIERVWDDGIASVRADLREWLRRAALDGTWTPWRFELSFGLKEPRARDPGSTDEPVELDSGIKLRGSIDLVERSTEGSLRATDYKTGKVRGKQGYTVIEGGSVLQPVLYSLVLEKLFPEAKVEAGRLYYCTSAGGFEEVKIPLDEAARSAADEVALVIGGAISEGFLPAAPAKGACEYCDYRPVCGPYEEIRAARKSGERLGQIVRLREMP